MDDAAWYFMSDGKLRGAMTESQLRAYLPQAQLTDKFKQPGRQNTWLAPSEVEDFLAGVNVIPDRRPIVDNDGKIQCIRCGSTQVHAGHRGWRFWRGGIFGSARIIITCLRCGQEFLPGGEPY